MAENKQNLPDKVAVFVSGGLYDNSLGRLEKGYQILDSEKADATKSISDIYWFKIYLGSMFNISVGESHRPKL